MENLLPTNWAKARLEEICLPVSKWNANEVNSNDQFDYLDINSIDNIANKITDPKEYTYSQAPSRAQQIVHDGDIIFSTVRTYLKNIAQVDFKYDGQIASTGFCVIRPITPLNKKFIFYQTLSRNFLDDLNELQRGSSYPAVRNSDVLNQIVALPPIKEQNRIVEKLDELFSELEKGEEQLQTTLEQLKIYRQVILKQAFEGKLTEDWRKNQKRIKKPDELVEEMKSYRKQQYEKELKDFMSGKTKNKPKEPENIVLPSDTEIEEQAELPKSWVRIRLFEIIENDSTKVTPDKKSKLKFIGMDCIESHSLRPFKYYQFADFKSAGNFFEKDRVLYGRMRPYLNKIWRTEFEGVCSGEFLVLKPFRGLLPDFLKYKLHSKDFVTYSSHKTSGDRPRISFDEVASYLFPLCSLEEQEEIVNRIESCLSNVEKSELIISNSLKHIDFLKQSLLKKAFEGKLVPQDLNDEPASVLLERIKKERETFLSAQKEDRKKEKIHHKEIRKMAEELKQILEILKEQKQPVSAKALWQLSVHKNDIDKFYADLKEQIESGKVVELPREGKESFLKLADSK